MKSDRLLQERKDSEHEAQLNVTYRDATGKSETVTLWARDHSEGLMVMMDSHGFLIEADGVEDARWVPWHRVTGIQFMGTAPEKPRSDRHLDY